MASAALEDRLAATTSLRKILSIGDALIHFSPHSATLQSATRQSPKPLLCVLHVRPVPRLHAARRGLCRCWWTFSTAPTASCASRLPGSGAGINACIALMRAQSLTNIASGVSVQTKLVMESVRAWHACICPITQHRARCPSSFACWTTRTCPAPSRRFVANLHAILTDRVRCGRWATLPATAAPHATLCCTPTACGSC